MTELIKLIQYPDSWEKEKFCCGSLQQMGGTEMWLHLGLGLELKSRMFGSGKVWVFHKVWVGKDFKLIWIQPPAMDSE